MFLIFVFLLKEWRAETTAAGGALLARVLEPYRPAPPPSDVNKDADTVTAACTERRDGGRERTARTTAAVYSRNRTR